MARLFALILLVAMPAFAAWQRYKVTATGDSSDSPPAHPLAYFRVHPCLRSDPTDRFLQCSANKEALSNAFKRTDLVEVGKVGRFVIFDLNYFFDDVLHPSDRLGMKSVLVQTALDQFQEIYVIEDQTAVRVIDDSAIIRAGHEEILGSIFSDYNGNDLGSPPTEVYFGLFGEGGPVRLDFTPVKGAAQKAIPVGEGAIWPPSAEFDFRSLTWKAGVAGDQEKWFCCDGTVTVTFRINSIGGIVPTDAKYQPGFKALCP